MFAGIIAFFIGGELVEVDVLGQADNRAVCTQLAHNTVEDAQKSFGKDVEIVIKCIPVADLKTMDKAGFMAAPIAAAGFGTKR